MSIRSQRALEPRGVSMNMETSWAPEGLATISGFNSMARFQQKQLQEKEQKLLQLYDQQQQRAHQVAQRGSAGSNTSNQGSTMNHQTVTRTTTTTRTTSTSQGGKVRQMFDERRQTTVKGIDRSYPLEPLDNKPKKQTSNGLTPAKNRNFSKHTVTTVKRTARADVNSNLNEGKPVVSYHEEFNRETFGDDEFVNENEVGRYLNGNSHELLNDDEETNRTKIHMLDFDKNFQHRVVNDLESEQFPEDLMVEVPDKVGRKPITKKLSQSELRLERFKNSTSRKNIGSKTITRKRSDPLFPTQTTTRDSPPMKTRKRDQEPSKSKDRKTNRVPGKKIPESEKNAQQLQLEENRNPEGFCQISRESEIFSNHHENCSELRSTFLIREIIQEGNLKRNANLESDEDNQGVKIEELEDDVFKIEEIEVVPCKIEIEENLDLEIEEKSSTQNEQEKRFVAEKESPEEKIYKSYSSTFLIERTPSPDIKKSKIESHNQEVSQKEINSETCSSSPEIKDSEKAKVEHKNKIEIKLDIKAGESLAEQKENLTKFEATQKKFENVTEPQKRKVSTKTERAEKRKESIKMERTEKRKESIKMERTEKRKESIKTREAEKIEDNIFTDDNCFRNRGRRKIKDSIREKLDLGLRDAIRNKFTLPVKKPQKKKSHDESRNLKIMETEIEGNFIQELRNDSDNFSRGSSPEKMFERPSEYQEILIEDQTIDPRRKNTPSPQMRIKSRRQSVENSETISSAAKRKPSLENRKLSSTEINFHKERKTKSENTIENTTENTNTTDADYKSEAELKINLETGQKSLDLKKPLKSTELVKQANKTNKLNSLLNEIEEFSVEIPEHKIVKKQEAIFAISDETENEFGKKDLQIEAKMMEVEIKRKQVEDRMNEIKAKEREFETKIKEVEEKRKEFEARKTEVESKKKEVESKMKEIETQLYRIQKENTIKTEIEPTSLQLETKVREIKNNFEISGQGKRKSVRKSENIFKSQDVLDQNSSESKDEVDKIDKSKYKVVKEIKVKKSVRKSKVNSDNLKESKTEDKLKKPKISRSSPMPKNRQISSDSVKSDRKEETVKSPIEIEITCEENTKCFKRTDSVESALRRFDSIGTDQGINTSKESIRNKSPDSTKLKSEKSSKTKEEKSSKNLQIRKTSNKDLKNTTPQRPIAAPRNQRKSRRDSEDGKNFDFSRISAARDSIELTRNFIRTRSPSCKRKLFQDSDSETRKSPKLIVKEKHFGNKVQESVATVFQEKWKVTGKEKGFLVEKESRQFSKSDKEGERKNYQVSVKREMRKEIKSQSSNQAKENRVFVSGTFVKKGKSEKSENILVFRNARSPSPDFEERKQVESSKFTTRRNVPSSPSKSPDSNFRRGSVDLKNSTKRPVVHSPKKDKSLEIEEKSDVPKDEVDSPNLENPQNNLEANQLETESSNVKKKCEIFVVDFNDSENKKVAKKPILKNEKPVTLQKQSSSNPVPRPSSSLSASSGGSSKEKMNSKYKSPASRGSTPRSSLSMGSKSGSIDNLVACKTCGRRFNSDRIQLHEQICTKAGQKKRKQFDAMKFRLQGTDLEPFAKPGVKKQDSKQKKPSVKPNWRKTHEDFINTIRSAKQVQAHLAAGGKLSDLPPPPPSDNSDYIQCPHCGRKFNEGAAERHIPKCENMRHNKPNPRAPPKPRR